MLNTKIVGVPKEIKTHEYRVGMTPYGVKALTKQGIKVNIEKGAGLMAGFPDMHYVRAGANLLSKEEVFANSSLIVKVKEPQVDEYSLIRHGQTIFTYFHFAGCPGLQEAMQQAGAICIPYETVQKTNGSLPLLIPMSEIAGKLAIQEGMRFLLKNNGGAGVLLSGVTGVEPGTVVIIGGGVVGTNAANLASGLGAKVIIFDTDVERLRQLSYSLPKNVLLLYSSPDSIAEKISNADLVIGAVLLPGQETPKVISSEMLGEMKHGSVFVDVAIDQGGSTPQSHATTHENPVYNFENVTMYCVANMPGIVPVTATKALTNVTLPYVLALASNSRDAYQKYPELKKAIQDFQ